MECVGDAGATLLRLTELGLGVPEGALTDMTRDGWHHLRVLR
jgi:isopenicillin N synthase-like dioxygenase